MKTAAALFLAVLTAAAGCGKRGPSGADGKGDPDETGADLAAAKPDVTMKAADWHAEFKKDDKAAKAKYAGKVVELTGQAGNVVQNADAGVAFIHLKVDKDFLGVRCGTKDMNVWEKVAEGSDVTVRGRLPEFGLFTGELMPVHVVSVGKNPAGTMTAAELAGRFEKDKEKLKEEWDGKWVYVEGEFVRSGTNKDGVLQFVLKGAGKTEVTCSAPADAKKQVAALKPGQKVKALGQLGVYDDVSLQMTLFRGL
jgi:exonuclease VII large subunit